MGEDYHALETIKQRLSNRNLLNQAANKYQTKRTDCQIVSFDRSLPAAGLKSATHSAFKSNNS